MWLTFSLLLWKLSFSSANAHKERRVRILSLSEAAQASDKIRSTSGLESLNK